MTFSESTATLRQGVPSPQLGRPRGLSNSTLRASMTPGQGQSRVEQLAQASSPSLSLFPDFNTPHWEFSDKLVSSFLSRSRSQSQSHTALSATISPTTAIPDPHLGLSDRPASPAPPASWWGHNARDAILPRPWRDSPKRQGSVPCEQTDSWVHTRKASFIYSFCVFNSDPPFLQRVTAAVTHVLGTSLPVIHEALLLTCEFLDVVPVPVPGLQTAAKILLAIWDSVQGVDVSVH
jgi:hypothetical protein